MSDGVSRSSYCCCRASRKGFHDSADGHSMWSILKKGLAFVSVLITVRQNTISLDASFACLFF